VHSPLICNVVSPITSLSLQQRYTPGTTWKRGEGNRVIVYEVRKEVEDDTDQFSIQAREDVALHWIVLLPRGRSAAASLVCIHMQYVHPIQRQYKIAMMHS
jgi:hypothetical protein